MIKFESTSRMSEELIEAVRTRTFLYDTNHPDYLKFKLKDEIWNEIAKELNLRDGAEAKHAWLKLRNCHRNTLRRQRKFLKNGVSAVTIKQWRYQKQMEFLVPYMANRPRDDEDSDYEEIQKEIDIGNVENQIIGIENNHYNEYNTNKTEKSIKYTESLSISSTATFIPKTKRIKKEEISSILKRSIQRHDPKGKDKGRNKFDLQKASSDHLYHFFMSMYEITRRMPPASQLLVRNKVFQSISQVEADLLNITRVKYLHSQTQHPYTSHPYTQHPPYPPPHPESQPTQTQYNQSQYNYNQSQHLINQLTYSNPPTPTVSRPPSSYSSVSTPISSPMTYNESSDISFPSTSTASSNTLVNFIKNFSDQTRQ